LLTSALKRLDEHFGITIFSKSWRVVLAMWALGGDDIGPNFLDEINLKLQDDAGLPRNINLVGSLWIYILNDIFHHLCNIMF
jgi:hypothetical protein